MNVQKQYCPMNVQARKARQSGLYDARRAMCNVCVQTVHTVHAHTHNNNNNTAAAPNEKEAPHAQAPARPLKRSKPCDPLHLSANFLVVLVPSYLCVREEANPLALARGTKELCTLCCNGRALQSERQRCVNGLCAFGLWCCGDTEAETRIRSQTGLRSWKMRLSVGSRV